MSAEPSIWNFIVNAGVTVQFVILILIAASIASWTLIFQRSRLIKQSRRSANTFETRFWSGIDLKQLFQQINQTQATGLANVFYAGLKAFNRLQQQTGIHPDAILEGTQRAMRVATAHEFDHLERHLSFLATVGSTSPYVGLFGTVWGIMSAFRALGTVQQATIAMVAPGISEALIATAIGLFAAIPAVIAYNRFSNHIERLNHQYELFQEELTNILQRRLYQPTEEAK